MAVSGSAWSVSVANFVARRYDRRRRVTGSSRRLQHLEQRRDVSTNLRDLAPQLLSACGREMVVLRLAVVLGNAPLAGDQPSALETMEGLVERRVGHAKHAVAPLLYELCDAISVHRLPGQRLEDQDIDGPLEQIERLRHAVSTHIVWGRMSRAVG